MSNSRIQIEIVIGAMSIIITSIVLVFLGFREGTKLGQSEVVQQAESIEFGAELFSTNCSRCHGENGEGRIGPPLNDPHFFTDRLQEVGWGGTLKDYIVSTVSSGRPVSTRPEQWPGEGIGYAMPPWSQDYGGPLRPDQIRDIADFIMNWEQVALGTATVEVLELPGPLSDDPVVRGKSLFNREGCAACHTIDGISAGTACPDLTHIATVGATRVGGSTAQDYIHQSILEPSAFVVEGFQDGVMPQDFSQKLSESQLEDLMAFLMAQE